MRSLLLMLGFAYLSMSMESSAWSQTPEFDLLEMQYDQGHYRQVYRKAGRFMDNPEFDYSYLPRYYRAISALQLAQNDKWRKRNKNAIVDAREVLLNMNKTIEGRRVLAAHSYELSSLKKDLEQWASDVQIQGDLGLFRTIAAILNEFFKDIPSVHDLDEDKISETPDPSGDLVLVPTSAKRQEIISEANKHLGTPYKWAGTTPAGFDCSGFTTYVYQQTIGTNLQRRAVDQFNASKRIKQKHVKPGDLVFFDNGSGISHVGIIVSTEKNTLQMVHASTSKGIQLIDILSSNYWNQRIAGFGSYIND
jgi:hypothetical protein